MSLAAAAALPLLVGLIGVGPPAQGSAYAEPDTSVVLRVPAGRMAEPTVAVSPYDPDRVAVAADPYLDPTRIQVVVSRDGGRTWTPPVTVRPPGFSKSFDPDLAFTRSGELLISGGASRTGRAFCQPNSAVFLARLPPDRRARPSYELVVPPRPGVYVDRPGLAYQPASGLTAVSWTRSTGPGAECRAVPRRSTTMLAWRRGNGARFTTLRVPVPKAAAHGSELAMDGPARVRVAVASWDTAGRQVISVTGLDLERGKQQLPTSGRESCAVSGVRAPPHRRAKPRPRHRTQTSEFGTPLDSRVGRAAVWRTAGRHVSEHRRVDPRGSVHVRRIVRLLVARRSDLAAERTRAVNRLHDQLLAICPAMERALQLTNQGPLILLTGSQPPPRCVRSASPT